MKRFLVPILLLVTLPSLAEEEFRFVRPVHVVQNKRAVKNMPAMDVTTFRPGKMRAVADPPEVAIGERLFIDTRFAQYFAANYDGNVNHPLAKGDPILDEVEIDGKLVRGPFKTRSMNCRSCHFVAEFAHVGIGYNRTYTDFSQRSRIPDRDDGQVTTPRNSMSMLDSFTARNSATLLHADGEFASITTLIKDTLTGRNYGWLPSEYNKAVAHIAKVIRQDDGTDAISFRYGGAYSKILAGIDPNIHFSFKLPKEYTIDVNTATDQQILDSVAKLVGAYLESLTFARDNSGIHNGSPYDLFLKINNLPAAPAEGETDQQYTARLAKAVNELKQPKFVDEDEQTTWFQYHNQKFNFGPQEFEGLKIFLRTQENAPQAAKKKPGTLLVLPGALMLLGLSRRGPKYRGAVLFCGTLAISLAVAVLGGWTGNGLTLKKAAQKSTDAPLAPHVANCTMCHTPPDFTDRRFHNNGATQEEFDSAHGAGSFANLAIPSQEQRLKEYNKFLPATRRHPHASGLFRSPASESDANATDLGMWNVFGNPDYPEPQASLEKLMCGNGPCDPKKVLSKTIALFRTPTLRDLGDSNPYMHTGRFATPEDVVRYYIHQSELARNGQIRNGAPELQGIMLTEDDVQPLLAFLRSLNEDYD